LVYYDLGTGEYFHFIENDEPGIGHLDTMLATNDSLFLADVSANGSMDKGATSGVIYQIKAISRPEPPAANAQPGGEKNTVVLQNLVAAFASRQPAAKADRTAGRQEIADERSLFQRSVLLPEAINCVRNKEAARPTLERMIA